ncbi:hypothetical protein EVAR_39086_1 [Eumeta japonica]|uniref:Uncharacterized protein n=1 Tax=Eumeta variegata TaxID=151549 RepID=A0A4C1WNG7_EUMVA|nr:hypothetical protein EVAR_39086_1 [Eumeta japonica]
MNFVAIEASKKIITDFGWPFMISCHERMKGCSPLPLFITTSFRRVRTNLTDDLREGRPTATPEDDISAVRLMTVTHQQIWTNLGIASEKQMRAKQHAARSATRSHLRLQSGQAYC